jgi:NADP-dependent 3-hydroxy acid dehydrogenase YdfG
MANPKTAWITGAGTGIGRAIAVSLSNEGANLALFGRTQDTLEETADACKDRSKTEIVLGSVEDRAAVAQAAATTVDRFGRLDILVNNAGTNGKKRNLSDMPPEEWDRVISINLTGAYNCFKAGLPHFEKQTDGLVINIASMAGKRAGTVGGVAYSASKFGMASLTQSINAEFRETGIRACCIFPGEVDTPILQHRPNPVSDAKRQAALQPDDVAKAALMVANLPDRAIVEEITIFPRHVVPS